ncbi:MAG TPA: FecR family protein [Steroidobacteraceae bacterium]
MTNVQPGPPDDDDGPIERSLEAGLRRQPLDAEAYARMHAAVTTEWRATIRPRSRWGTGRWGIAAGLAAAVLIIAIGLRFFAATAVLGVAARVEGGGLVSSTTLLPDRHIGVGGALRVGDMLLARGSVLVELNGGGTLRIANGTRFEAISADGVALHEGEIYVDLPPSLPRTSIFIVRTALGLVEHVGTQFDVATVDQDVRIRVREGVVRLRRGSETETAASGTELLVPKAGHTSQRTISTHGPQWSWIEALEPDYDIENRKLMDFLLWTARETGRRLSFGDDRARDVAERTHLHGSIHGMSPATALEMVLTTTSLRYEFEEDLIRVSSGG